MNKVERFLQYAADFEATYADDDWSRLRQYFTEDATYEGDGADELSFRAEGLDAVLEHLKNAVDTFDRRFEQRRLELSGTIETQGDAVSLPWEAFYSVEDAPTLKLIGQEEAVFEGDKIKHLKDTFDEANAAEVGHWMVEHGSKLAP